MIRTLAISNYRSILDVVVPLEQLNVITGPNGEVHSRSENTAGYCAFGGGEPNCDVWVFYPRGNKWPGGKTIENGPHSVTITITATSRAQLDELYRTLSTHPLVKVVL